MPRKTQRTHTKKRSHSAKLSRLKQLRQKIYRKELLLLLVAAVLLLVGVLTRPHDTAGANADISAIADVTVRSFLTKDIRTELLAVRGQIKTMEDTQAKAGVNAVPDSSVQAQMSIINIDLEAQSLVKARRDLGHLKSQVPGWQNLVTAAVAQKQQQDAAQNQAPAAAAPALPSQPYWQVPILIYHDTPPDFERQLQTLVAKGYHAIDLDQLYAAMTAHGPLPPKPAVITLDDGFADQITAFNLLKKYDLKATFYIIDGGDASNWCIGAGRLYNLSSQPAGGCGDQYLSWDQVREIDQSGLITIGSHTVDHLNLPSLSPDQERFEIAQGKATLEAQLGHPVRHFAYPYGSYNSTTVAMVQNAGFLTAVSTIPGIIQTQSNLYSLHRVRDTYDLP